MKRKGRAKKRLSPYRRLEAELANARNALRNAVFEYVDVLGALRDAVAIIDHFEKGGGNWTVGEVQRLKKNPRPGGEGSMTKSCAMMVSLPRPGSSLVLAHGIAHDPDALCPICHKRVVVLWNYWNGYSVDPPACRECLEGGRHPD